MLKFIRFLLFHQKQQQQDTKKSMYIVSTQMYINFNEKVFQQYYRHQKQSPNTTTKKCIKHIKKT